MDLIKVLCNCDGMSYSMAVHTSGMKDNNNVLVAIHGLTRRGSDFVAMADRFKDKYYVCCPDIVGRGDSDWLDSTIKSKYGVPQYIKDIQQFLISMEKEKSGRNYYFFGTSMGGLISIDLFAALIRGECEVGVPPITSIKGLILNDIGPCIESSGLVRLMKYCGKPFSFIHRKDAIKELVSVQFTPFNLQNEEQVENLHGPMLRKTYSVGEGEGEGSVPKYVLHYDPEIALPFAVSYPPEVYENAEKVRWTNYETIADIPILITRGADSDLLSIDTVEEMKVRHHNAQSVTIPNCGHAPTFLNEDQLILVESFFNKCG
jgi:cobalt-zinc-cadmium efflux system protein